MNEMILHGKGDQIVSIPRAVWEEHLSAAPEHADSRLKFMSTDHHRVRNYVVREIPRKGAPIPPEYISADLNLPLPQLVPILDVLEKKLFFLVRDEEGTVVWAYPVTAHPTAHSIKFSTGEQIYAA